LSRIYVVHDARGERQLDEQALPLSIGGNATGDIVMPGVPAERVVAHIAASDGHAYIQTADNSQQLFHNHEHLGSSQWLKSGDEVQLGDAVMSWTVQGDVVIIATLARSLSEPATRRIETPPEPALTPPQRSPPDTVKPVPQGSSSHQRRWLVFAVFVLLLLASAFVLLATPVTVHVTPEPARQSIHGFPPPIIIGDRRLALPGRYTVQASREGYRDLQTEIDVERGGLQTFSLELEELPGRVRFQLQPVVDYRIFINDVLLPTDDDGVTAIAGGSHQLRIETDRYLPVNTQVDITGHGQAQQFVYELVPGWANVNLGSVPAGAVVHIDGVRQGVTPLVIEVMAGEHRIEVSLADYKTTSIEQEMTAGMDIQPDTIVLVPADGHLSVSSKPAGATISVGGVFYGTTPATLSLSSAEQHRVRLNKPGYRQIDKPVKLAPNETRELAVTLPPEHGVVFVTARPADASISIDGKPAGDATQRLRLTTRPHTLAFSKPGYVSQQLQVTPRAGVSKNINVTLKTTAQAVADKKAASRPALRKTSAGQRLHLIKPAGSFRMGASRREAGRRANESPRLVQLLRPFYLSEKEVTNAQYRRFKSAHNSGQADGASLNADTQPVVNISWDDAARYCNWLSKQDGLPPAYREDNGKLLAVMPMTAGYRLPSEAEWAYVARKLGRQEPARYPWAGKYPPAQKVGNFADAGIADTLANTVPDYNDGYRGAAPVGSFPVQSGGFYDLGGNVAEWSHDYYAVYPGMAETLVTDPVGPASGDHHVVRDSSWRQGGIAELRLSYRDYSRGGRPDLGFRIARYAE
jgi:formylglycine-generating enzyme required for sulfatase activity